MMGALLTDAPEHPTVLLRPRDVIARCGISRSTLYALVGRGEFPAQVRITNNTVGFVEAEVEQWLRDRIAASREGGQS